MSESAGAPVNPLGIYIVQGMTVQACLAHAWFTFAVLVCDCELCPSSHSSVLVSLLTKGTVFSFLIQRHLVHFSGAIYIPKKTAWQMFEAQACHPTAALAVGTQNGGKQPAHSSSVKSKSEGTSRNNMVP